MRGTADAAHLDSRPCADCGISTTGPKARAESLCWRCGERRCGAIEERGAVIAWLRAGGPCLEVDHSIAVAADAIERGDHRKVKP